MVRGLIVLLSACQESLFPVQLVSRTADDMILLLQIRLAALVLLLRAVRPSFAAVIDDGRYAGSPNSSDDTTTFDKRDAPSPHVARSLPLPSGIPLKLLPIGDSITVGVASTDLNGYRLTLENSIKGSK